MWRQIEPRGDGPASRFGYVSMTYNNVFLLFGGYDGSTWLNDMHEYNFGTQRLPRCVLLPRRVGDECERGGRVQTPSIGLSWMLLAPSQAFAAARRGHAVASQCTCLVATTASTA